MAEKVAPALAGGASIDATVIEKRVETPPAPQPLKTPPGRNDALNLLSALQREARFVDFLQEPLDAYSNEQVGAAVRDVHRDCASVLKRIFALEPLETGAEGSPLEVPAGFEPTRYRLVGAVAGRPPYQGRLCHHGWQATRCELPAWTGANAAALIVAPAEVEITSM